VFGHVVRENPAKSEAAAGEREGKNQRR